MNALANLKQPFEIIDLIHAGLPFGEFEGLRQKLGISAESLAEAARINPRTLHRRKKEGTFTPEESDRLYRLLDLYERGVDAFESEIGARDWLVRPGRMFGGRTPLQYADTEVGYQELLQIIEGIKYGGFG
ncbi:MAG: antitoxin Xre-like helix-turn-helix domain-containing protein [Candidatus Competibacteraceae bacterium]